MRGVPTQSSIEPKIVLHGKDEHELSTTDACPKYTVNLEFGRATYQQWKPGSIHDKRNERVDKLIQICDERPAFILPKIVENYKQRVYKQTQEPGKLDLVY